MSPQSLPAPIPISDGELIVPAFERIRQAGGIPELVITVRANVSSGVFAQAGLRAVRHKNTIRARPRAGVTPSTAILRKLVIAVLQYDAYIRVEAGQGKLQGDHLPSRGAIERLTEEEPRASSK